MVANVLQIGLVFRRLSNEKFKTMKTRLIIQFSGWHENGRSTEKHFTILNIEGDITMETVVNEIEKTKILSVFRKNKEIKIYYMQAF